MNSTDRPTAGLKKHRLNLLIMSLLLALFWEVFWTAFAWLHFLVRHKFIQRRIVATLQPCEHAQGSTGR